MDKTIVITSDRSVGCTFLDWSILYLSGQDDHYLVKEKKYVPITHDPINNDKVSNAHNHNKNYSSGSKDALRMIQHLEQISTDQSKIKTIYPFPLHLDRCLQNLGISLEDFKLDQSLRNQAKQFMFDDYRALLDQCLVLGLPLIFVEANPSPIGYYWHTRSLDRMKSSDRLPKNLDDLHQEMIDLWFHDSHKNSSFGSDYIWDQRERLALDLRPFKKDGFFKFGSKLSYKHIDCQDLWNMPCDVVSECFDYLKLGIQKDRWDLWNSIAATWQKIQHQNLKFYHQLDHIVAAIVNGWYFPLPKYDIKQEAIIQHCLIYQHNLNIKTWNLESFPDNTQKLHALLEPNIHKVPSIY